MSLTNLFFAFAKVRNFFKRVFVMTFQAYRLLQSIQLCYFFVWVVIHIKRGCIGDQNLPKTWYSSNSDNMPQ